MKPKLGKSSHGTCLLTCMGDVDHRTSLRAEHRWGERVYHCHFKPGLWESLVITGLIGGNWLPQTSWSRTCWDKQCEVETNVHHVSRENLIDTVDSLRSFLCHTTLTARPSLVPAIAEVIGPTTLVDSLNRRLISHTQLWLQRFILFMLPKDNEICKWMFILHVYLKHTFIFMLLIYV